MKYLTIALLYVLSFSLCAEVASHVDISIIKSKDNVWTLNYRVDIPVKRLGFIRNPDLSRIERWKPLDNRFEITTIDGKEYIQTKDGSKFKHVSLRLTPTYKPLPKDYAPFSPYSDGGNLIHTGRLFACAEHCDDEVNQWQISLQTSKSEKIIVDGDVYLGEASWSDSNDGKNIYVGTQELVKTDNVIAVIDNGLPHEIKDALDTELPKFMDYFENHLGKRHGNKPILFASYAKVKGGSSQGGTLPQQVFMHWNIDDLDERVKDKQFIYKTLWFFAHEAAHFYQSNETEGLFEGNNAAWLHEGHADWLAAKALLALYPETKAYVARKSAHLEDKCIEGMEQLALYEAADKGRFDLHYACGFMIHRAIDLALHKQSGGHKDIFSFWRQFIQQAKSEASEATVFFKMAEQQLPLPLVHTIKKLVETKLADPQTQLASMKIKL